jgi:hypothetical protein
VAIPATRNVTQKEAGKKIKYKSLCIEIQRMWSMKCMIIRVIIRATGIVKTGLKKNLEAIPGKHPIDSLQKAAILGTSHIIRKVLQSETGSLSGGNHRWFKRSSGEKRPVRGDSKCQIIIIIIIIYCNNNFNGKYWAIVGPKLSGPPVDADYQGPDYQGTTVLGKITQCCSFNQM